MTTTLLIGLICFLLVAGAFLIGYGQGKRSRNIALAGKGASEALAYFILKEISRHREDIAKAKNDLKALERKGIVPPDIPLNLWVEVKK